METLMFVIGVPLILGLVASLFLGSYIGFWRLRRKGCSPFQSGLFVVLAESLGMVIPALFPVLVPLPDPFAGALASLEMIFFCNGLIYAIVRLMPTRQNRVSGDRRPRFRWMFGGKVCYILAVGMAVMLMFAVSSTDMDTDVLGKMGTGIFTLIGLGRYLRRMPMRLELAARAGRLPAGTEAVVYLRAFQQESTPFVIGTKAEYGHFSHTLDVIQAADYDSVQITLEKFLTAEIEQQLGPFIALGNPEDYLPPEGARRVYAPDSEWMTQFQAFASTAIAIILEISHSGNLSWELDQLLKTGWVSKLYVLTPPAPLRSKTRDFFLRLRGIRLASWAEFVNDLNQLGYQIDPTDPGDGAVITFDRDGRSILLGRGAKWPMDFVAPVKARIHGDKSSLTSVQIAPAALRASQRGDRLQLDLALQAAEPAPNGQEGEWSGPQN